MTTEDIVTAERPSRARTMALLVSLLDRLPAPKEISFSLDYPGSMWIHLDSVEDFDEWTALMNARVDSRDQLIHSGDSVQSHAAADWHGRRVYLQVCILVSNAERLTAEEAASVLEEPERTLTAVERDAEPVPYDASVEDAHEHGFTFREGLGYLADDPFCDGCCELATAKWKASWKRPTTNAEKVTADVDAKTAEAVEL